MAKNSNEEDAPEDAEGTASEEGAGGSTKKLIMFGAIGAVALSLIGGGGYFVFLRAPHDEAAEHKALPKKPVGFLEMREMTVNLAPDSAQDRARFLKFKVSLEVKDPKLVAEIQPLMPRVEDSFQLFLRELRASDLEGSVGLYRLREELLRRVNIAVYPAKVDAVLFKEMIVQ
jgi:flagellar protein FliL